MASKALEQLYGSHKLPLVLGHRGASYDAPENTLAAFNLAKQQGADGIELDTMLSRDGIPVVIHDVVLDNTTNGTGLVGDQELRALRELDAGSHFDAAFKGETIPTLGEVLDITAPDMIVNIELKTVNWWANGLEAAVLSVIRRHAAAGRVFISSFNPMALRRFRALAPHIPIGYLYSPDEPLYLRYGWLMAGMQHDARHPHHSIINARYMAWAKARGFRVHTWTVDAPERMRELRDLGIDAIITNRPDLALETLGRVSNRRTLSERSEHE